jgi:hypothetical protein
MLIQPDGKILIGGDASRYDLSAPDSALLVRLLKNGNPDKLFGTDGSTKQPAANGFSINAMALQSGGRIVTAGGVYIDDDNYHPSLARYFGKPKPLQAANARAAVQSEQEPAKKTFDVYPVPANKQVYIKTQGVATIVLSDAAGKLLLERIINGTGTINVSAYSPGTYFIKNSATLQSKTIVITH